LLFRVVTGEGISLEALAGPKRGGRGESTDPLKNFRPPGEKK